MATWQMNLAAAAAAVTLELVDERVQDRLRMLLLHNLSVGLEARDQPAARAARHLAPAWGDGQALLLGGGRAGLLGAIFCNATCMAASIREDAWNGQHLGSALVPTALAVARQQGSSGGELLAALAAGYGAAMTAAARYGAATGARGFRGTAIYGQIGAAVVAAKLLGFGAEGISRALSIAANAPGGAPGPLLDGCDEVLFQSGLAAVKGTLAALAALAPIVVSDDGFGGRGYFEAAYAGAPAPGVPGVGGLPAGAVPTAAELAALVLEVGIRPYPLNHLAVAPVAAALVGRRFAADEIESVTVWMAPNELKAVSQAGPFIRPRQAMFSAPLAVVAALLDGDLTLSSLQTRALDPEALALAGRVRMEPDASLAPLTARVTITTASGQFHGDALDAETLHRPTFAALAARSAWPALAEAVAALPATALLMEV